MPHICIIELGQHWLMACHLLGAKQLPEPMMAYCQLNTKYKTFLFLGCQLFQCHVKTGIYKMFFYSCIIFFCSVKNKTYYYFSFMKMFPAKLAAILSRGRWLKQSWVLLKHGSMQYCIQDLNIMHRTYIGGWGIFWRKHTMLEWDCGTQWITMKTSLLWWK